MFLKLNNFQKYIVGGTETTDNQYPPMVGLFYTAEELPFCGAAISKIKLNI